MIYSKTIVSAEDLRVGFHCLATWGCSFPEHITPNSEMSCSINLQAATLLQLPSNESLISHAENNFLNNAYTVIIWRAATLVLKNNNWLAMPSACKQNTRQAPVSFVLSPGMHFKLRLL